MADPTLSPAALAAVDASWRAANYLSVGQTGPLAASWRSISGWTWPQG